MYKVLLVDDEPLILSGIKFLIDWEAEDCSIIGSARNGKEAYEKIIELHPDIVVCDINMPVLSGVELLKLVNESLNFTVFIMLTNHQEFDLAQLAIRYRAVDYLLKSQLEAEALILSLNRAKQERNSRNRLAKAHLEEGAVAAGNKLLLLEDAYLNLMRSTIGSPNPSALELLSTEGILDNYAFLQLILDFSSLSNFHSFSSEELKRLFAWQGEIIGKLSKNFFSRSLSLTAAPYFDCILLLVSDVGEDCKSLFDSFFNRLCSTSANITGAKISLLSTEHFCGDKSIDAARSQLFALRNSYYLIGEERIHNGSAPKFDCQPLGLSGIAEKIAIELKAKNINGCNAAIDKAIARINELPHQRNQAIWLCSEIISAISGVFSSYVAESVSEYLLNPHIGFREIEHLHVRSQVVHWLEGLQNEISNAISQQNASRPDLLEQVKQYVLNNIDKRIMLQDAADYVCISPSYLSGLFKRLYNQNFIDYVNANKMERACELIRSGRYRIGEIAYMLSYENAYYFSKVFKKHKGMTPSEYQYKIKQI